MKCATCGAEVERITSAVDPRSVGLVFAAQCGDEMDPEVARGAWRRGMRWEVPTIDAGALVIAERRRQVTEEGHDADHDAAHTSNQLSWAAWSYIDAAMAEQVPTEPPKMWPWPAADWKPEKTPIRLLVVAAALIHAEIDRRLRKAGITRPHPDGETP